MKRVSGKVLLYSINFAPELTGIGKYNGEMVRWLVDQGYDVRVLTAPPYYPQWQVPEGYSAARYAREDWHGAGVWRCPVWVPRRASGVRRLLHLLSFAVSSAPLLLRHMLWRPDLVIVVEPPLVISPLALLLAKLLRIKSWLHVQDFEVDAAFELGLLPNRKGLKRFVTGLESMLMRGFRIVSSISEPMLRRLAAKGVPEEKIRYFPNWVDASAIFPLEEADTRGMRRELGIEPGSVVALYAGNMGEKQGLETVLEAADLLRGESGIRFVLCGDGAAKAKLMDEASRKRLENVRFLPLQPVEKLNALLGTADIHLLVQKRQSSDLVMPSKLGGMLASGRPVVATADPGTAIHDVLAHAGAGRLVPPEEPAALAAAVRELAGRQEERRAFGRSARQYAVGSLGYESIMSAFQQTAAELGVGIAHEAASTVESAASAEAADAAADQPHPVGSV